MSTPTPGVSLREKAERATPGPWTPTICGSIYHPSDILARAFGGTAQRREANAAFIAACSPDVILALLSRVERAEADSKRWRERFERCATDGRWWIEVEDGAACVAFFEDVSVTNGQATVAECFDDAMEAVWDGGVMRREFQARLDASRQKIKDRSDASAREMRAQAIRACAAIVDAARDDDDTDLRTPTDYSLCRCGHSGGSHNSLKFNCLATTDGTHATRCSCKAFLSAGLP